MKTHSSGDLDGHRTRCTGDAGAMSRGIFDQTVNFFSQKTRHLVTGRQNKTSQNKTEIRAAETREGHPAISSREHSELQDVQSKYSKSTKSGNPAIQSAFPRWNEQGSNKDTVSE